MRKLKESIQKSKTDPSVQWDPWVLKQLKSIPMTQEQAQCFLKKDPLGPQTFWVGIESPPGEITFINSDITYGKIWKKLYVEPCNPGPPPTKRAKGDPNKISEQYRLQIRLDFHRVPQMTVLLSAPQVFINQMWNRIPDHLLTPEVTTALR